MCKIKIPLRELEQKMQGGLCARGEHIGGIFAQRTLHTKVYGAHT